VNADNPERYGSETYWGRKFVYRALDGEWLCSRWFRPRVRRTMITEGNLIRRLPSLPAILDVINRTGSSMYRDGLIPVALAHAKAAYPIGVGQTSCGSWPGRNWASAAPALLADYGNDGRRDCDGGAVHHSAALRQADSAPACIEQTPRGLDDVGSWRILHSDDALTNRHCGCRREGAASEPRCRVGCACSGPIGSASSLWRNPPTPQRRLGHGVSCSIHAGAESLAVAQPRW